MGASGRVHLGDRFVTIERVSAVIIIGQHAAIGNFATCNVATPVTHGVRVAHQNIGSGTALAVPVVDDVGNTVGLATSPLANLYR